MVDKNPASPAAGDLQLPSTPIPNSYFSAESLTVGMTVAICQHTERVVARHRATVEAGQFDSDKSRSTHACYGVVDDERCPSIGVPFKILAISPPFLAIEDIFGTMGHISGEHKLFTTVTDEYMAVIKKAAKSAGEPCEHEQQLAAAQQQAAHYHQVIQNIGARNSRITELNEMLIEHLALTRGDRDGREDRRPAQMSNRSRKRRPKR